MKINTFPNDLAVEWAAADTETHTYIDGKLLSEEELLQLGEQQNVAFFREHTTIDVYAWLISDGTHFAWLETFDEFCTFCAEHRIHSVWWYNAKFDFACIDYQLLTDTRFSMHEEGHMKPFTWSSLHNDFGARYQLAISFPYKLHGKGNNHTRNHVTRHYDFCNIFGGGLAGILESFNVTDFDGKPIRKLTMDYQAAEADENAIQYMRNDVDGLYHAIRIADGFLNQNFGRHIAGRKPDIMTAGALAKKTLLNFLYHRDDKGNVKCFQLVHQIGITQDSFYRERGIYRGGICIVNPAFQNKLQTCDMWRYDVNSMYPAQMHAMPDIKGFPRKITWQEYCDTADDEHVYVFSLAAVSGYLQPNALPVWYDQELSQYVPFVDFRKSDNLGLPMYMFDFEFFEMNEWYQLDAKIEYVLAYRAPKVDGYRDFVDTYYKMKADGKREKNKIKQSFAKLCLNSSYGKLAQNPVREECHREINEETGAVHLVIDGQEEDEDNIMSILQGAYITAKARTFLLSSIRDICHGNPKKYFVYCDTDSIHAVLPYDKCDAYQLGALKDETEGAPFNCWKYLAPKTYFDAHQENGRIIDLELHSKGINTKTVMQQLVDHYDGDKPIFKSISEIDAIFSEGVRFPQLTGMNVRGGKALIPIAKFMCQKTTDIAFNAAGEIEILQSEKEN